MKVLTANDFNSLQVCYADCLHLTDIIEHKRDFNKKEHEAELVVDMKYKSINSALDEGFFMKSNIKGAKKVTNATKFFFDNGDLVPLKLVKHDSVRQMQLLNKKYFNKLEAVHTDNNSGAKLHQLLIEK